MIFDVPILKCVPHYHSHRSMGSRMRVSAVAAALAVFVFGRSDAYSQQLGAYYSGLGMDTLGSGGVNCLFLAFFDPSKMTATNCNFTDPNTPCVAPAPGGGGQGLAWVRSLFRPCT